MNNEITEISDKIADQKRVGSTTMKLKLILTFIGENSNRKFK